MKNKMTFLRWMVVIGLTFLVNNASAQWKVGVQAGYTHNSLSTESGYAYDRHYDALGGFTVGVPVQYEFVNWFALQADLSYTQKNYALYRSGRYADIQNETNPQGDSEERTKVIKTWDNPYGNPQIAERILCRGTYLGGYDPLTVKQGNDTQLEGNKETIANHKQLKALS